MHRRTNKFKKIVHQYPFHRASNINSLRNKITQLREVCRLALSDLLCIDETKPDASFPDAQFHSEDYWYLPFRRDRYKNGGGMIFIRKGLVAKRLYAYEESTSENMCLEVTMSKKK